MHPENQSVLRKRIRLDPNAYMEAGTQIFLTISTRERMSLFVDEALTFACIETLKTQATNDNIGVSAFCFMPDHIHILASVNGQTSVTRFVQQFKGRTTRIGWSHGVSGTMWQRSFYDHVLRESELPLSYVEYILQNPVQQKLSENWWEYPFNGSFTMDLEQTIW